MPMQAPRFNINGGFTVPGRNVPSAPKIPIYTPPPLIFKPPILVPPVPIVFKPPVPTPVIPIVVPSLTAPSIQPPVPVVFKVPTPTATDLALKSLGLKAPVINTSLPIAPVVPQVPVVLKTPAPTSTDITLKSLGVDVHSVSKAPATVVPPIQPPGSVILKTSAPTPTDIALKSLGVEVPVVKVSAPVNTIFVQGLNREVKTTEITNVNPSVDIQKAKYFILVHDDVKVERNKQTGELTLPFSTGHRNVEFVAEGESQGIFGKQPSSEYVPIGPGKVVNERDRHELSKDYDKEHGTSLLRTKIIPVTKEQYDAAHNYAKNQKDSGVTYYNIVNNNCNDFVNDVLKQAITDKNLGQLYTEKELKGSTAVNINLKVNYGASDISYIVSAGTHMSAANIADKYKVHPSRVIPESVDPLNPDIMHFMILRDNTGYEVSLSGDN